MPPKLKRVIHYSKLCTRPCERCGNMIDIYSNHPRVRFCSISCSSKAIAEMLRGRGNGKAYRKLGQRHAHRVIAEQKLGRKLRRGEIVHHIDGNILNNDPDNLEILPGQSEHASLHFKGRKHSPEHIQKRVETFHRTIAARKRKLGSAAAS